MSLEINYLTLTNVVFESVDLKFLAYINTNLTLTNVVFEFAYAKEKWVDDEYLTLTNVVFELTVDILVQLY